MLWRRPLPLLRRPGRHRHLPSHPPAIPRPPPAHPSDLLRRCTRTLRHLPCQTLPPHRQHRVCQPRRPRRARPSLPRCHLPLSRWRPLHQTDLPPALLPVHGHGRELPLHPPHPCLPLLPHPTATTAADRYPIGTDPLDPHWLPTRPPLHHHLRILILRPHHRHHRLFPPPPRHIEYHFYYHQKLNIKLFQTIFFIFNSIDFFNI